MTRLALNLSEYVNGVGTRHAEVSAREFPGYQIHAVANGVHPCMWTSASFTALYNEHLRGWRHEPEILNRIDQVPDELVVQAHRACKDTLIRRVRETTGVELDADKPILGFARRMTAYKRPDLLFFDLERLQHIAAAQPFQLVIAGKAHPRDDAGHQLIELLHRYRAQLTGAIPVAFLPNYGMELGLEMVAGSDVWLNTPLPPLEASGTSGMKTAFNGVPSLSILDGWWIDGCIEDITGWAIGNSLPSSAADDAHSLYEKLESQVLPLYRAGGSAWVRVMKGAIGKNAAYFNSHRMMRRYATEAYIR